MANQIGALGGGIGLFLLGMWLMTEGLRLAAGAALRDVLTHSTRTRRRALASGFMLTALVQSSSAVTALTLTAAQGGLLGLEAAAAVVIGANIGTTGTAVIAAIGATANARRAAAAHVLFNVLTAAVALAALPSLLDITLLLGDRIGAVPGLAAVLALFHTLFNVLGALLMWPLSDRLADFLAHRFRTREEDDARPRDLDAAVTAVPTLAVEALAREVARYGSIAVRMARTAVQTGGRAPTSLASAQRTLTALDAAIDAFVVRLNRGSMTQDTAQRLAIVLRRAMYYTNVAELLPNIATPTSERAAKPVALSDEMARLLGAAADFFLQVDPQGSEKPLGEADAALTKWEEQYQRVKAGLLREGALGNLAPVEMESLLRSNSALRRAVQQAHKAAHAGQVGTTAATAG